MSTGKPKLIFQDFTDQERAYIDSVYEAQEGFQEWLKQKKGLPEKERSCFSHISIADASSYWTNAALQAGIDYDTQHMTGWKHWARTAETVAVTASQFMKQFKPLIEFSSNSGPYGGIAVGAISGLFALVQSKSKTNDVIASQVASIMDRLPGFNMLERIYNESLFSLPDQNRLRRKIALAYSSIVYFGIASAKYYLKPGISRWWLATWNPEKFTMLAETVQNNFFAVRLQSEEMLTVTVHEIHKQNTLLNAKLIEVQQSGEQDRLIVLQNILGLSEWSPEEQQRKLDDYKQSLGRARQSCKLFEWMDSERIAKFKKSSDFTEWKSSSNASMLLIVAVNDRKWLQRVHCWVSPLAIDLIHNVLEPRRDQKAAEPEANRSPFVYYVFNPEERTTIHEAMSEILLKLLKVVGRLDMSKLSPKLEKYHRTRAEGNERTAKEALADAVVTIAQLLDPQQEVCIVLDRIDRCDGKEQKTFVHTLMRLVQDAHCCVKILAVANKAFWEVEDHEEWELAESLHVKIITETQRMIY